MMPNNIKTIRDAAILTTSYVAATTIGPEGFSLPSEVNQLVLYVSFTKGSLTSAELKVEFSPDGTNWFPEEEEAVSSGVGTLTDHIYQRTADGPFRLPIRVKDAYIKVSVKGTGTVTGSSMAIVALVGRA